MTKVTAPTTGDTDSLGRLNYLDSSLQSSLYRNGKVLLRRDADGSDSGMQGVVFDERQMPVHPARLRRAPREDRTICSPVWRGRPGRQRRNVALNGPH